MISTSPCTHHEMYVQDQASGHLPRPARLLALGLTPYEEAHRMQLRLVDARKTGLLDRDVILILEHPPVFTIGRNADTKNLKVSQAFLDSRGIQVHRVERGGDITYHGPGQLVVYPMVNLKEADLGVLDYVSLLEEVMVRTAADCGLVAGRSSLGRGVWTGERKLGSLGIAVRHSITFHGLALNVNTDTEPFTWVHPCGLQGVRVVSMKEILGREVSMEDARLSMRLHLEQLLGLKLAVMNPNEISALLGSDLHLPKEG